VILKGLRKHSFVAAGLVGFWGGFVAWTVGEPVWYYTQKLITASPVVRALAGGSPDVVFATTIGLYLGFFLGAVEGLLALNLPVLARGMLVGGVAGLVGGCLGTLLGETAYTILLKSAIGQCLGWALFGALLGVAPGMVMKAVDRAARGFLGGLVGGFGGGIIFLCVASLFQQAVYGRMVAIPLLGACLGCCYGLAETLMRRAWVTVLSGRNEGYQLALGSRPISIGSSPRADLQLVANPPLAGIVARIVPTPNGFRLERGELPREMCLINQTVADEQILRDGDMLRLGGVRLLFSQKDGQSVKDSATKVPSGPPSTVPTSRALNNPPPAPATAGRRVLEGLSGPVSGRQFALKSDRITIGRDDDNDIVVEDLSVSLKHAEIVKKGKLSVVFDRGSSNGTFVQGRRIQENALKDGFLVDIGQIKFRYLEE
jgi:hypothetical protein